MSGGVHRFALARDASVRKGATVSAAVDSVSA